MTNIATICADSIKITDNNDLAETVTAGEPKQIKLIYRANIFERTLAPERPYRQPRAINWRFRVPGKNYDLTPASELLPLRHYGQARAVNWRFQVRQSH